MGDYVQRGDRVLMLDGSTMTIEHVDGLRDQVRLGEEWVALADLEPLVRPDLSDPAAVTRFIEHDWQLSERVRFDSTAIRCELSCSCKYCYRVTTTVDGEVAAVNHFVDAPKCDCMEKGCPCL